MQLIKISDDHYVIVNETILIEEGKVFLTDDNLIHTVYGYNYRDRVITHSTKPIEAILDTVKIPIEIIELKEVESAFSEYYRNNQISPYIELTAGKFFSREDMIAAYMEGHEEGIYAASLDDDEWEEVSKEAFDSFQDSLVPKLAWNCIIENGKLKLL